MASIAVNLAFVALCTVVVAGGFYVAARAERPPEKIVGYGIAAVAFIFALVGLLTIGVTETSSGTSDVQCWNFPDVEMAQAFYDVAHVQRPGFYDPFFDPDVDGIACEEGVEYRPE